MSTTKPIVFQFLDFEVNPEIRSITLQSQPLKLSKKCFDLLVMLLKSDGGIISKDELITEVWPNQIVTDDALYKQITRLKKALQSEQTIIETVRGIGIRFVPNINKITSQQEIILVNNNKSIYSIWILLLLFIISIPIIYNRIAKTNSSNQAPVKANNQNPINLNNTKETKKIHLAIIPTGKTQEWLTIGGLNYLSDFLQQRTEIETISPQSDWFDKENTILALKLTQQKGIDFSLVIKAIEHNNNFSTHVYLRNSHGVLAENDITAQSLKQLFENIDQWSVMQLNITSGVIFKGDNHLKNISNYALESYLRGLTAARNRKLTDAQNYLQSAVNEDKTFYQAWLLLSEVTAELGQNEKALAIIETLEHMESFDTYYLNDLYNAKARTYLNLRKFEKTEKYLNQSIEISIQQNDMKSMIVSLSTKALIQGRKGELSEETEKIVLKQLELVKKYNPLPNLIAQLNHNLAIINQALDKYDKANKYTQVAIKQYKKMSNATGIVSSYGTLSDYHYDMAQYSDAILELEKAQRWIDKVESPYVLAHYYKRQARNLYETGLRKEAQDYIEKLNRLSIKDGTNQPKISALTLLAELQITYGEFDTAKETVKQLLNIVLLNPESYPDDAYYIFIMDLYLQARFESPITTRDAIKNYQKNYPEVIHRVTKGHFNRIEGLILFAEGYHKKAIQMMQELMDFYIKTKQIYFVNYVGYELLDMLWQYDMEQYNKTLNLIDEYSTFDYPLLKYRAKYFAYKKDHLKAVINMQELKAKAKEFWSINDQLLLEKYQKAASSAH